MQWTIIFSLPWRPKLKRKTKENASTSTNWPGPVTRIITSHFTHAAKKCQLNLHTNKPPKHIFTLSEQLSSLVLRTREVRLNFSIVHHSPLLVTAGLSPPPCCAGGRWESDHLTGARSSPSRRYAACTAASNRSVIGAVEAAVEHQTATVVWKYSVLRLGSRDF